MKEFFKIISLLVDLMKSCVLQIDTFTFSIWDLNVAIIWISSAILVFKAWRDRS